MGIFNKTEEERKREAYQREIGEINRFIYDSEHIPFDAKASIAEFVNNITKGNIPNPFDDIETLRQILFLFDDLTFANERDCIDIYDTIKKLYPRVVKKNDDNYERMKTLFMDRFLKEGIIYYQELYDESIIALFENKEDYFEILSVALSRQTIQEYFKYARDYMTSVCKYCLTQDVLKRDIIAYLNGFSDVVDNDYEKYNEECLEKAKRRIGVYNLSPKDLAIVDTKLRRVDGYLDQCNGYLVSLTEEKKAIAALVDTGREDIKRETTESIQTLKRMIEEEKKRLMEKLDTYLLDLEETLKGKSDETFRQIIETYKSQVSDFRTLFKGYSAAASSDLLAIQRATQDSINTLQEYVSNEPQLKELLSKAQEENMVRERIIQLVEKEEELKGVSQTVSQEQIIIPGFSQVMVPYRHLVLPETIVNTLNPFFNDAIPFDQRFKKLEDKIKLKESQGVIYHKKARDIAVDLMEGDWPYLWGPSGTGKSYLIKQVADLLDMKMIEAGKITEPYSVLGYNDPQGRFCITPSFVAVLYGQLLSLDEFDNGNPDTQIVLNKIYSELLNKIENPKNIYEVMFGTDVPVDIHPNFRMIAAGNTSGDGENELFSSRGKIDESIQERLSPIYIDYDKRVEAKILEGYPSWYNFFIAFREVCLDYAKNNGLDSPKGSVSTRDAAAIRKYVNNNSKLIDQIIAEKFVQIKDSEYRKAIGRAIADKYNLSYSNCGNEEFSKPLKKATEEDIAKKLVYYCRTGVR